MKKVLEIYDISDDYHDYQGNPYIVVLNPLFEVDKDTVKKILSSQYTVLTSNEWLDYKNTITDFNNNDAKHRLRKESSLESIYFNKPIKIENQYFDFEEDSIVSKAIEQLSLQGKRRFIKYFIEGKTYREIGEEESKNPKTIYESVQRAKKKFLENLKFFENTPHK